MRVNRKDVMSMIGLSSEKFFDLLLVSADLRHWLKEKETLDTAADQLPEKVDERVVLIACLMDETRHCFGGAEGARRWFSRCNRALGGRKPKKVLFDGVAGINRVCELLGRIRHGVYS